MGNKIVQPEGWAPAKGYANGILTEGKTLYIGGQIGWNSEKIFEEKDFIGQMEQVLKNIKEIVEAAGGGDDVKTTSGNVSRLVSHPRPKTHIFHIIGSLEGLPSVLSPLPTISQVLLKADLGWSDRWTSAPD